MGGSHMGTPCEQTDRRTDGQTEHIIFPQAKYVGVKNQQS